MKKQDLHTIIWKEDELFVAKFLEIELASQGKTKKEAIINLREAFNLRFLIH
jgi:predicted RNase H-like HicB family nuclease